MEEYAEEEGITVAAVEPQMSPSEIVTVDHEPESASEKNLTEKKSKSLASSRIILTMKDEPLEDIAPNADVEHLVAIYREKLLREKKLAQQKMEVPEKQTFVEQSRKNVSTCPTKVTGGNAEGLMTLDTQDVISRQRNDNPLKTVRELSKAAENSTGMKAIDWPIYAKFDGISFDKALNFLEEMETFNDEYKSATINEIAHVARKGLVGNALMWMNAWKRRNSKSKQLTWEDFKKEFVRNFLDKTKQNAVKRRFLSIKQAGSLQDYTLEFQILRNQHDMFCTPMSEVQLRSLFLLNLKNQSIADVVPTTPGMVIEDVIQSVREQNLQEERANLLTLEQAKKLLQEQTSVRNRRRNGPNGNKIRRSRQGYYPSSEEKGSQ